MAVAWYEALVEPDVARRLVGFDHYRIRIGDEPAVLITYLGREEGRRRGVFAVTHPAAGQHPAAPGWLCGVVQDLRWAPCPPPEPG